MPDLDIKFPGGPSQQSSYRLLELPSELLKLVESSADNDLRFTIKGAPDEDAVLCTENKTYTLRSVVLSNSVLVMTPPKRDTVEADGDREAVVIRDTLGEILELVPAVPKLHRLKGLLRGMEWEEGHEDEDDEGEGDSPKPQKRQGYSYEQAKSEIQSSEEELRRALRERHILVIDGNLRPLTPSYLLTILELLLIQLVSLSQDHQSAAVTDLIRSIEDDHDIKREVIIQVMEWFGKVSSNKWRMDVEAVVTQVGLGILRHYKDEPIAEEELLATWRKAVGDKFASQISLALLLGNYLTSTSPFASGLQILYFPQSELPTDPSARFADLFLTRSKWKAVDIAPFLADIVVDNKDRDKLLLKYARAQTDKEGIWYTARAR
ncbi:hypothetical protein EWM64_g7313 [Hericium alpestre]|uniref:Sister chromatid cohesion protein DCC1 n=1 Tax=Hericium alpestre TaxID=135208 RepID=A0A4Y9ZT89_9AGAM|nr:hypothetical protein EWM64_g7313 [Hericium alpestre]